MAEKRDLTGMRFNKWLVIKKEEKPKHLKNNYSNYWLCVCNCGTEKICTEYHLTLGTSKGCKKCSMLHKRKKEGENTFNKLFGMYKNRGKEFLLTKEQFEELTKQNCHYCNVEPKQVCKKSKSSYGNYVYNGIDRKDSKIGYIYENCVTCCGTCNRAKASLSYTEFINWIKQLTKYRGER